MGDLQSIDENAASATRLRRIAKVSRLFRYVFSFLLAFWVVFALAVWFLPIENNEIQLGFNFGEKKSAKATPDTQTSESMESVKFSFRVFGDENQAAHQEQRIRPGFAWFFRLSGFIFAALQMAIFWILQRLFRLFENGNIFDGKVVQCIRWAGWWLLAYWAEVNFLEVTNFFVMNPAYIDLHVDLFFVSGIIVLLISWIMEEGCKLQQEQELTV